MTKCTLNKSLLYLFLFILPFLFLPSNQTLAKENSDLVEQVESLKSVAEEYRGLDFLYDVPVVLLDQREAADLIARLLDDEIPDEANQIYSDLYIMLGLLPRGTDFLGAYQEMTEEQVAGLYDPAAKTFYIVDMDMADMYSSMLGGLGDIPGVGNLVSNLVNMLYPGINDLFGETIIVHEMTHALDDQHFNIEGNSEELREGNSDDAQLAYQSLLEGSATLAMNRYQFDSLAEYGIDESMLGSDSSAMDLSFAEQMMDYEPFIERLALTPYVRGSEFLQVAFDNDGTSGIDTVFNDPPVSMEQILHPEKYYTSRDIPSFAEPIDLSDALHDWESEADDTLGELITGMVFEFNTGDTYLADSVAQGWDYDIITSWRSPEGDLAFSWLSVWDTDADAGEFFDGYKTLLEIRYPDGIWSETGSGRVKYSGLGLACIMEQKNNVVVIIEGVPENKAEACLAKAWKSDVTFN